MLTATLAVALFSPGRSPGPNAGGGSQSDLAQYVDPLIGSDAHGHVFVGASVPFGAVQVGPNNVFQGWDWTSGYHYSDKRRRRLLASAPERHGRRRPGRRRADAPLRASSP